jgi:hypothetical protein
MNTNPNNQHARSAPAVSSTVCWPNRATIRRASREPIRPPTQGAANARPYCQGEHEDGEQRLGRHDQTVDQDGVDEQRAQRGVRQDVAPSVEHVADA